MRAAVVLGFVVSTLVACAGGMQEPPSAPAAPPPSSAEGASTPSSAPTTSTANGCTKDTDCKGERICVDGTCSDPNR